MARMSEDFPTAGPMSVTCSPAAAEDWTGYPEWAIRARTILGEHEPDADQHVSADDRRALMLRSREVPDWRRPPERTPVDDISDEHWATLYRRADLELRVGPFRRFEHGLLFRISAVQPDAAYRGDPQDALNLSFRIRPDLPHRIRLLAYADVGGDLMTNTAHPGEFPSFADNLWIVGGTSGRGIADQGVEARAEYFVSPYPGTSLTLFASYPEFGIPASGVHLVLNS